MSSPGFKLRQVRQRLGLTYRDVETASSTVANSKLNAEFTLPISRLSEIENHGAVPSVYRIYTLSALYGMDYQEVLGWYGLNLSELAEDQEHFRPESVTRRTHLLGDHPNHRSDIALPIRLDPGFDPKRTTHLTRMIETWGRVPVTFLERLNSRDFRYGYVGQDDWRMYPLIPPGSLVQFDVQRRQVHQGFWHNEHERPVYFVEHRDGYACTWCCLQNGHLILQPHPLSPCQPETFAYPQEADVLGQVVGVAKQLPVVQGKAAPK